MEFMKELLALNEVAEKGGWISIFSPLGIDFDSIEVFKSQAEADDRFEELDAEADMFVENIPTKNGFHVVVTANDKLDDAPLIFIAYAKTEAECKQITSLMVADGKIMGPNGPKDSDITYLQIWHHQS